MNKHLIVFSAIFLLLGSVSANEVYYEMDVDEEKILMNTTVLLECEDSRCPHNWRLKWSVPEDAELLSIEDSRGEIEEYMVEDGSIEATSNKDDVRDPETFKMKFRVDRESEEIHDGLYKRQLSLRSFEGAETTGNIEVDNFLSSWTGYGVETSVRDQNFSFRAEGPLTVRTKFGDNGYRTDYYEFFDGRPENTSMAFEVASGTTGQSLNVKRLPVALLPDEKFNRTVSRWSSGEYVSGSAQMRQDLGDEFLPVLTHETVHALNERKLNWDDTSSSYFEEGTSTYVEFLVQKKLYGDERIDRPPRELFGEDVRFDPDPTDNYYNTLPPKGDADVLWGYYQNDEDFMKQWNPFDSPPEYRSFGYAYSELVIKNHIVNANGSVRDLYSQIDVDREISDPEEKWSMFSEHVDLTPCKHETREEFDECLENINSYNYTVYSAEPSQTVEGNLDVRRLEVPEREEVESDSGQQEVEIDLRENVDTNSELNSRLNSVFEALRSVLDRVVGFIQTEF